MCCMMHTHDEEQWNLRIFKRMPFNKADELEYSSMDNVTMGDFDPLLHQKFVLCEIHTAQHEVDG
jgi:hypothetical protein